MHLCVNIFWLTWLIVNCLLFLLLFNIIVVRQLVSLGIWVFFSMQELLRKPLWKPYRKSNHFWLVHKEFLKWLSIRIFSFRKFCSKHEYFFLLKDNRYKTIYWSVRSKCSSCRVTEWPFCFTVCQFSESKCVIYSANLHAVRNKGICQKLTNFYCLFIDVKIISISGREPVGCMANLDLQ